MEIERYAAPLPSTVRELAERLLMDRSTLGRNLQIRDLEYGVGSS
jgi:DNA-binding MarR family transcriptional regulator